ncbi:MAG: hypothetical protein ACPHAN_00375 [Pseudomonadales bacterium]
MAKRWQLLKDVGAGHGGLLALGTVACLSFDSSWILSWNVGVVIAGLGALAQVIVLMRGEAPRVGVSQALKLAVFGVGTAALMVFWREIHLTGFVMGIVCSQLMWVLAGAKRSFGLLRVATKRKQ